MLPVFDTGSKTGQQGGMTADSPELARSRRLCGGRIAGRAEPAFEFSAPHDCVIPILIAVPHAGRAYPPSVLEQMRDPAGSTLRLEDRWVDLVANEVAARTGAGLLIANAPRAILDLNRALDDVDWGMIADGQPASRHHSQANRRARSGLGLIPRRLSGHGEIWRSPISRAELVERIEGIHRPYHAALAQELEAIRDRWGAAVLIDMHSMPPLRPRDSHAEEAQFVIGDRFGASCDAGLAELALAYFARHDRPASHNRPYSGGFALERHATTQRGIHAMQIEVCRSTYLDARLEQPSARLAQLAQLLAGLVRELGREAARLGASDYLAQAAE